MHAVVMVIWLGAATPAQAQAMQMAAQPTTARHDILRVELQRQRTSGQVDKRRDDLPSSMR